MGPSQQKGTKWTQTTPDHKTVISWVRLCFVSCKTLSINLSIYGMLSPEKITSYQSTKLENMVKFYVPTWSIFAGPVTYNIVTVLLEYINLKII